MIQIRWVVPKNDADEILRIYKPFIENTAITFELEVPSVRDFSQRLSSISAVHPFLVCEIDSRVAGYAYASTFRTRSAYDWCKELSVYVDPEFRSRRVAKALYSCCIDILKEQGICQLIGGIALPNDVSVAFHEKLGFRHAGTLSKVGYKFEKWWDVGFWELSISNNAKTLKTMDDLPSSFLQNSMSQHVTQIKL